MYMYSLQIKWDSKKKKVTNNKVTVFSMVSVARGCWGGHGPKYGDLDLQVGGV
jgi:hypothetical protein